MMEILLIYLFLFLPLPVLLLFLLFFVVRLISVCCVLSPWPLGGAPNYYPNSFSAPETQPRCVESKFKVSPDVARYNTDDEDNVSQVETEGHLTTRSLTHFLAHISSVHPLVQASLHVMGATGPSTPNTSRSSFDAGCSHRKQQKWAGFVFAVTSR